MLAELPWRGPEAERPPLPVPPERMPVRWGRRLRKRWRWVGAFGEETIAFAAIVQVGPAGMTFWGVWDRAESRLCERTRRALPWRRSEIEMGAGGVRVESGSLSLRLELAEGEAIESICPNGEGGYTWTRKLAGVPISGEARIGARSVSLLGLGVDDRSAGYHPRRTRWRWSAGVGVTSDARTVGWNLVSGINDPPRNSERSIWIEGRPSEPGPVEFDGLEAIRLEDGSRLDFIAETERVHDERLPLLARSEYRAAFGSFSGTVSGLELSSALGVMEEHDVLW